MSAGHWHKWLMSAWPRHSSPHQRHCTVTTLVSMETAMSMSTSALKSIGGVPGSHFLPLGWGTSNFCSLCLRPSVRFSCEKHNICCQFTCRLCVFVCFFSQPGDSKAKAERSDVLPNGDCRISLKVCATLFSPPPPDTIDAGMWCGNHWP